MVLMLNKIFKRLHITSNLLPIKVMLMVNTIMAFVCLEVKVLLKI
jgi:hypothetical protein